MRAFMWFSFKAFGTVIALGAVTIWGLVWLSNRGPGVGEDAHLRSADYAQILAAPLLTDLDGYHRASAGGNNLAVLLLDQGGKVFPLSRETRVRVVNGGGGSTQVRVLDGPHAGETVWVSSGVLVP